MSAAPPPPRLPARYPYSQRKAAFMAAIAQGESGGSGYDHTNAVSGAYGKYQVMPRNWPEWSKHVLGFVAEQTPENQELVVGSIIDDMHDMYALHRTAKQPSYAHVMPFVLVAAAWRDGRSYIAKTPYDQWSSGTRWYVYHALKAMVGFLGAA